ncbi:MAG TPA: thiamine pyrophosphate-binding protein [Gemmataceae bacterium]|jgi:sulfopyruvate decarboxylase subunit alpha|nr:thiamine pyrophosphate-binding protein [Gemmataceae bacterium]
MMDGPSLVGALEECGITHVIWIPDSELGTWDKALSSTRHIQLIRVCREGEAMALAAGLILGGKKPLLIMQCTGFFEAGDSFRNIVHDLKLPLFLVVGLRSYHAFKRQGTRDSCPVFAEPVIQAWQIRYLLLENNQAAAELANAYRKAQAENHPMIVLVAE